jgi:hypothetical protein
MMIGFAFDAPVMIADTDCEIGAAFVGGAADGLRKDGCAIVQMYVKPTPPPFCTVTTIPLPPFATPFTSTPMRGT